MRRQRQFSGGPLTLLADLLVVLWVVLWLMAGLAVADATEELTVLGDGVAEAGGGVIESGKTIGSIDIPVVGGGFNEAGEQLQKAGRDIEDTGRDTSESVIDLSRLLGLAVTLLGIAPLLIYYLPPRLARAGEALAFKRMLREGAQEPGLEEFLARRAAHHLPYRRLRKISEAPWRDLDAGRHRALAEAELRRMGVARRRLQT